MERAYLFVLVFLVSVACASAVSFEFSREKYHSCDSVQAQIHFDAKLANDLKTGDVGVYSGGVRIPVSLVLLKISDSDYYCYFSLCGVEAGSYALKVSDVYLVRDGKFSRESFGSAFSVDNTPGLKVWPGYYFITAEYYEEKELVFSLENPGVDLPISLSVDGGFLDFSKKDTILGAGAKKDYIVKTKMFDVDGNEFSGAFLVNYSEGGYRIPILVHRKSAPAVPVEQKEEKLGEAASEISVANVENISGGSLVFVRDNYGLINHTIYRDGSVISGTFTLMNNGNVSLSNISYIFSGDLSKVLKVSPLDNDVLDAGQSMSVRVKVNTSDAVNDFYSGSLIAYSGDVSAPLDFAFYAYDAPSDNAVEINDTKVSVSVVSAGLNDNIVEPEEEKKSFLPWFIVIAILVLLGGLILLLYRKMVPERERYERFIQRVSSR